MRRFFALVLLSTALAAQDAPRPPQEILKVPAAEYPLAERKAKLAGLLIKSLELESQGIVDLKVERQIHDLMIQIQKWPLPVSPEDSNPFPPEFKGHWN